MITLLRNKTTLVWAFLVLATALSWEFGHGMGFGDDHRRATVAIMLVAFIKVRYVMLDFMEVRHAPVPLRVVFESWVVVVCSAILIFYLSGPQIPASL